MLIGDGKLTEVGIYVVYVAKQSASWDVVALSVLSFWYT